MNDYHYKPDNVPNPWSRDKEVARLTKQVEWLEDRASNYQKAYEKASETLTWHGIFHFILGITALNALAYWLHTIGILPLF